MHNNLFKNILFIALLISVIFIGYGQETKPDEKLKFSGDFRFRGEFDRDSRRMDGSYRDDRDRLRYRLRLNIDYKLNSIIAVGARIRTGNPLNQQSANITIGDSFSTDDITISRAFMKVTSNDKKFWAWGGKNAMPFWGPNQLLWDSDVNPEGISTGANFNVGERSKLIPLLGYYIYSASGSYFKEDSNIYIGQLKFETLFDKSKLEISTGILSARKMPNIPEENHDFELDYNIWATSIQYNIHKFTFSADFFQNLTNYDSNENVEDVYKNQKTGYSAGIVFQQNKFRFFYRYAHIEKYAVIDYLAQDDYMRWGGQHYARSSNYNGSDIGVRYDFYKQMNVVLRGFYVDGIKTTGIATETGTRVRLDFNIQF